MQGIETEPSTEPESFEPGQQSSTEEVEPDMHEKAFQDVAEQDEKPSSDDDKERVLDELNRIPDALKELFGDIEDDEEEKT